MKPNISEFSYGYALTSELVDQFGLKRAGAPYFPSLKAEGKSGGFDVQLPGLPVFLQFKLSDILTTKNAKDQVTLGLPYYRFHLRALKYSKQHDHLLTLEQCGNLVYYVAPRFHEPRELNGAFTSTRVLVQSAFLAPSAIGALPDQDAHSVSFAASSTKAVLRSAPRELELADPSLVFGEAPVAVPERTFQQFIDELIEIYLLRQAIAKSEEAQPIRRLAYGKSAVDYARLLALWLFESELLFFGEAGSAS
jgi:hypothetical protein